MATARSMKRQNEAEVLYGVNPVLERLRSDPTTVRRVLVSRRSGEVLGRVEAEARRAGVRMERLGSRELERLARGKVHQGVVAEVEPFPYLDLEDLLEGSPPCVVLADGVTDPRNLGALARAAAAAGAGGLVLPRHRSAGMTPVAAKAAAGALARLPVARVTNLVRAIERLKEAGYRVVGLDAVAERSVFEASLEGPTALVLGSEGRGLRRLIRESCDERVTIPMAGGVDSLNVAVAGAVVLFERARRRWQNVDRLGSRW